MTSAGQRAQRLDALEKGDRIRLARAQLKRDLKAGRVSICDLLLEPPAWLEGAKVFDVLLAVPRLGRVRVLRALDSQRISAMRRMGDLTMRQRVELVAYVRMHGVGRVGPCDSAMYPLSGFQERVLGLICDLGWVSPPDIARYMDTDSRHARATVAALQARGLLDERAAPTESAYAVVAMARAPERARVTPCAGRSTPTIEQEAQHGR